MGVARIRAVTFDFWNTLMFEGPNALVAARLAAFEEVFAEHGTPIDLSGLERAHDAAFREYERRWIANQQYCVRDAVGTMLEVLGMDDAALAMALESAFSTAGAAADIREVAGLQACLENLRSRGLRLGIICDIGLTPSDVLVELLARRGLLAYFATWSFSDKEGVYKPDPAIFRRTLDRLEVSDAADAAHVGDRRRTDIAGAQSAGMFAVLFSGVYDDPAQTPVADAQINDLLELTELIS